MSFEEALENNPAPKRVGDTRIRLDSPVLLGEAQRPRSWLLLVFAQTLGASTAFLGAFLLLWSQAGVSVVWPVLQIAVSAGSMATASYVETRGRRRRFLLNFSTYTLRLDFSTPIRGMPQAIEIPFDDVLSVEIVEQRNRLKALVLEFRKQGSRFREVLVADISERDEWALSRLHRALNNAFHIGAPPTPAPMSDSVFPD